MSRKLYNFRDIIIFTSFIFQSNYNFCMKKNNLQEHHEETFGKDESYETFVNEIKSMAEGIMQLSLQAVQIYTPIVNRIISDTSATQHEVEYLMDFMLSPLLYRRVYKSFQKTLQRNLFTFS